MSVSKDYLEIVRTKLDEVIETELANIEAAAELVAEACANGGRFFIFGTGHSHMLAEELYLRAGGLAIVRAILPPEMMLHEAPNKSTLLERVEGYAEAMLELHDVNEKDVMVVISNSGRNAAPVGMCIGSKERGAKVICVTSLTHSKASTSRSKSGKKMYEVADVVIDNHAEKGDAAISIEGLDTATGATSNTIGIAIMQALACESIDKMIKRGYTPPVFKSSNVDEGDAFNLKLFQDYYGYQQ